MNPTDTAKEVLGVFAGKTDIQAAYGHLSNAGFPRRDIGIYDRSGAEAADSPHEKPALPTEEELKKLEDMAATMPIAKPDIGAMSAALVGGGMFVGIVLAAIVFARSHSISELMALMGLCALAGAALGALVDFKLNKERERKLRDQVRKGGLILWVNIPNRLREIEARYIMRKHGAQVVHSVQ